MVRIIWISLTALLLLLTGCNVLNGERNTQVGMLVETTIHDKAWGQKGYKGLQNIQQEYGFDVYFKEGIKSYAETYKAVEDLVNQDVNVIFGHGSIYGQYFEQLHEQYPKVEFVYFNGQFTADNVTSLNFSAQAMGFFAGMVAGEMTETNHISIIAVYEWQPEVEGFYEGVLYQNPEAKVHIRYTHSWDNIEKAKALYNKLDELGTDVFYPAGDQFNIPLITEMQKDGNYAIGYVSDQSSLGKHTVLTSTVQHVDVVYQLAMEKFLTEGLPGTPMTFDFQKGAISLGEFSPLVPETYQDQIMESIDEYKKTGKLPNE